MSPDALTCMVLSCDAPATWLRVVRHPAGPVWIGVCDKHIAGAIKNVVWVDDIDDLDLIENFANNEH